MGLVQAVSGHFENLMVDKAHDRLRDASAVVDDVLVLVDEVGQPFLHLLRCFGESFLVEGVHQGDLVVGDGRVRGTAEAA